MLNQTYESNLVDCNGDDYQQEHTEKGLELERIQAERRWIFFLIRVESMIQEVDDELTLMARDMGIQRSKITPVARYFEISRDCPRPENRERTNDPLSGCCNQIQPLMSSKEHVADSTSALKSFTGLSSEDLSEVLCTSSPPTFNDSVRVGGINDEASHLASLVLV